MHGKRGFDVTNLYISSQASYYKENETDHAGRTRDNDFIVLIIYICYQRIVEIRTVKVLKKSMSTYQEFWKG